MYIHELVIEVTRRCNIQCAHCLRGHAQAKDIDNVTIDKMLDGITSIGTITFTGGEPSLAVDRIRYIVKQIKRHRISVNSFYVVTNGVKASVPLMLILVELYAYCSGEKSARGEYFGGGLAMSQDQYHRELSYDYTDALELYGALTFFKPDERKEDIEFPFDEGMARLNGIGDRTVDINPIAGEIYDGELHTNEGAVYINALGDVIPSCDMSYESQEEEKIGSVHEDKLSVILLRHLQLEEVV